MLKKMAIGLVLSVMFSGAAMAEKSFTPVQEGKEGENCAFIFKERNDIHFVPLKSIVEIYNGSKVTVSLRNGNKIFLENPEGKTKEVYFKELITEYQNCYSLKTINAL